MTDKRTTRVATNWTRIVVRLSPEQAAWVTCHVTGEDDAHKSESGFIRHLIQSAMDHGISTADS